MRDMTVREDYEGSNPVVICYTCLTFASQCRLASVRLHTSEVILTDLIRVNILAMFVNKAVR